MGRIRILLADDHQIVIEGLRRILEDEFEIAGVAADGRELVRVAAELKPDVIVADVTMPLLSGIEAARQIRKNDAKARIVFLTMHPDATYAMEALDAGALGYVLKSSAGQLLVKAIHEAVAGRVFVSPPIDSPALQARAARGTEKSSRTAPLLTARQREVARLFAEGRTTKEIAGIMDVSARTVEFHKYRAMEALGLKSAAELIQFAVKHIA